MYYIYCLYRLSHPDNIYIEGSMEFWREREKMLSWDVVMNLNMAKFSGHGD